MATRRPDTRQSASAARSALAMLLAGATAERLAAFTVEGLAASYRVRPAEVARMLEQARKGRGGDGLFS